MSSAAVNRVEMVKCYEYTILNYYGEPDREIFVPPPYAFCINKEEMVSSDKARNIYSSYEEKEDSERPLTEIQMEKPLAEKIRDLIQLKLKIMKEEDEVEEAMEKHWKMA